VAAATIAGPEPAGPPPAGDLFRPTPVHRTWGYEHGEPLDRPFIERFVRTHAGDIRGRVLEIKTAEYSARFARPGARIDILDIDPANPAADIIADIQTGEGIADATYDCIVLTQVLQLVPDVQRALATIARILRPGGVLLLTAPGLTQAGSAVDGQFLRSWFAPGLRHEMAGHFDDRRLLLQAHGNAGLAASFLMGLTVAEVPAELYAHHDEEYPIVLTARAVRPLPVPDRIAWPAARGEPAVSIIIPMFNAADTIRETLFSVARQSVEDYEVLVVDDGSTDGSRAVAEAVAREAAGRVRILEHSGGANRGLSLTRNRALAEARGAFIVFLDADDTLHPEKLAHDLERLRAHPEAAAVVGPTLWWWDGAGRRDAHLDLMIDPADRVVHPPEFFDGTYERQAAGVPPCVHSWMIRREALAAIEPFDPEVLTYEDQKFLADLALRFPVFVASACLCEYRRKEATLWADAVASGSDAVARARFLAWKAAAMRRTPAYGEPEG